METLTVAAAFFKKDHIQLAADSAMTWEDSAGLVTHSPKIMNCGDLWYVGAGEISAVRIFDGFVEEHNFPENPTIANLHRWIDDYHHALKNRLSKNPDYHVDGVFHNVDFLLVHKGAIYTMFGYEIQKDLKYAAIGSGNTCAYVAMDCGKDAEQAVEAACYRNAYCRPPVQVVNIPL